MEEDQGHRHKAKGGAAAADSPKKMSHMFLNFSAFMARSPDPLQLVFSLWAPAGQQRSSMGTTDAATPDASFEAVWLSLPACAAVGDNVTQIMLLPVSR